MELRPKKRFKLHFCRIVSHLLFIGIRHYVHHPLACLPARVFLRVADAAVALFFRRFFRL